jgi:hypothetical protein
MPTEQRLLVQPTLAMADCAHVHKKRSMSTPERHCSSSREGKVMLSCWIPEDLRQELDRVWAEQGLRPHGRTQQGMELMIHNFLQGQAVKDQ